MNKDIQQVINQFPEREIRIKQLWAADEDFRDLSQDYALCRETLVHWSAKNAPQTRIAEYLSLCRRLELEIEIKTQMIQSKETES